MTRPIALLVALVACATPQPQPPPRPSAPLVGADAGAACPAACAARARLGCIDVELRDECLPTCERAARAGLYTPACVAAATTRAQMVACRVRCP